MFDSLNQELILGRSSQGFQSVLISILSLMNNDPVLPHFMTISNNSTKMNRDTKIMINIQIHPHQPQLQPQISPPSIPTELLVMKKKQNYTFRKFVMKRCVSQLFNDWKSTSIPMNHQLQHLLLRNLNMIPIMKTTTKKILQEEPVLPNQHLECG